MSSTAAKAIGACMLTIVAVVVSPDVFGALNVTIAEMPEDSLSKDAVYVGSLTFIGLVLFGSAMLSRAFEITRKNTQKQSIGASLVISGTLFVAILYLKYAFEYPDTFQESTMIWMTILLFVAIIIGAGMLAPNPKNSSNTQSK